MMSRLLLMMAVGNYYGIMQTVTNMNIPTGFQVNLLIYVLL